MQISTDPVHFELKLMRGLLFTDYMIAPTDSEHVSSHLPNGTCSTAITDRLPCSGLCSSTKDVNALTRDQLRELWHMRLGHINERLMSDLHFLIMGNRYCKREGLVHLSSRHGRLCLAILYMGNVSRNWFSRGTWLIFGTFLHVYVGMTAER